PARHGGELRPARAARRRGRGAPDQDLSRGRRRLAGARPGRPWRQWLPNERRVARAGKRQLAGGERQPMRLRECRSRATQESVLALQSTEIVTRLEELPVVRAWARLGRGRRTPQRVELLGWKPKSIVFRLVG